MYMSLFSDGSWTNLITPFYWLLATITICYLFHKWKELSIKQIKLEQSNQSQKGEVERLKTEYSEKINKLKEKEERLKSDLGYSQFKEQIETLKYLYEKTTILKQKEEILQEIYKLIKISSSNKTTSETKD